MDLTKLIPLAAIFSVLGMATGCSEPAPREAGALASASTDAPLVSLPPDEVSAAQPERLAAAPTLAVDGEGLRFFASESGSATPLAFGLGADQVLETLERVRGPAGRGTNESCGAGPVQYANWADGLSVVLQDGRFAGWGLDGRAAGAVGTANGIGPGSTRAELDAAFGTVEISQTSLGTEFAVGDIFGLLDGATDGAKITHMWSGVSCVAR